MYFNYNHRYERIKHLSEAGKAKNFCSAHFTSRQNRTRLAFFARARARAPQCAGVARRCAAPFVSFLSWQTTFSPSLRIISTLRNAALIRSTPSYQDGNSPAKTFRQILFIPWRTSMYLGRRISGFVRKVENKSESFKLFVPLAKRIRFKFP